MKKLLSLLMIVVGFAFLFSSCGKEDAAETKQKIEVSDTIAVQTAVPEKRMLSVSKVFSGNLEGEEQANVVAKIPERIIALKVKVGDHVSVGQLIVVLDKAGASSQYFQAEAGFLNAGKDLDRMKALYKEGAVSQQMVDGVQTQFNIAKANFEAAKSTVELVSPISGVVTAVNISIGDLATPGLPMISVASIGSMKIIFNAGEADLSNLTVGQNVEVYSEIKPELIQKGRISQISKSADISSRSFEIKAQFPNTGDRWFKPGMFAKVKANLNSSKGALVISSNAIVIKGEEKGVYVVNGGKVTYKKIQTGLSDGTYSEVISGMTDKDEVVTLGANNLKNGASVHVANK